MKNYIKVDEWKIIEDGFHAQYNKISESLFSIGNGRMGQRANFEEEYSGSTLQGNYVAGIYYPDKTRVGWWKVGYPEYFAKVLNAPNWIGIDIEIDGEVLDLHTCTIESFYRELDMQNGTLTRTFRATTPKGKTVSINSVRFCSIVNDEVGAIRYSVQAINFTGKVTVTAYVDADVVNQDANYGEKFWNEIDKKTKKGQGYIISETKKTLFQVCVGMKIQASLNGKLVEPPFVSIKSEKYVAAGFEMKLKENDELVVYKFASVVSSENHEKNSLLQRCQDNIKYASDKGFNTLLTEQKNAWAIKWQHSDIVIEGDTAAQQGIRFNIFQLHQTFTGVDARLNIGPKGFTGEKYGGSTYWDTEAYCLHFYLCTAEPSIARNLLIYRYNHLAKAIENAQKLGFNNGAALYPMVTMNGEESHNEWEITFEEIHRNGAIAYAIFEYVRYTQDEQYIPQYGLEVLIGIARFWAQRVHFSKLRKQYVIHGVTGPNEYENNVNNNWYTNNIAVWCMKYTNECLALVKKKYKKDYQRIIDKTEFNEKKELAQWKAIYENIYIPYDNKLDVFIQHDGFLEKELILAKDIPDVQRPLNQHWSWDRILRSCFIKQADVLQGLFFFEHQYDMEVIRRNFDFYEPMTVHESSLSPCVHSILANRIGKVDKAYELYLRTARLDLDDYNNDTEDGCHITSMAGTWMALVKGFGGMRIREGSLYLYPSIPKQWKQYSFKIQFREWLLKIEVSKRKVYVTNFGSTALTFIMYSVNMTVQAGETISVFR
ncbi:MAG: glycoside hydrolase family 65 protein [Saprospiraceae bacterium]|nr:glycoside hydrolase family 65 protein [Saprospiraceae bacterium]MBP7699274.1 glycoside hydrolase family 65 protein [Saprospiraceae bacterium]